MLERMRIDRYVPLSGEVFQAPDMIEVPMSQHDSEWLRRWPEPFAGRALDQSLGAKHSCIDQNPFRSARNPVENDVDNQQPAVGKIRGDLQRPVVPCLVIGRFVGTRAKVPTCVARSELKNMPR